MKALKIIGLVVLVAAVIAAIAAPIGPMPGFRIGGTATPVPEQWGDTSGMHEITLSVGDGIPRVVIIWVAQVDGALHVVGSKGSGWVDRLGGGGPVKLRMGDSTYDMQASLMSEGWEDILTAWREKYATDYPDIVAGFPSMEEARETVAVYRMTARG